MTAGRRAAIACAAAGAAWLALVPASQLFRSDDLSYAGYYRVMALPLLGFAVAWWLVAELWQPAAPRARWGSRLVLAGLALVFVGTLVEFWGSWLLDEPVSAETRAGEDAWWGSDVGWFGFLFGFLLLLVGGPTAAVALRRERVPWWVFVLVLVLGFGVFAGNALHDASLAAAAIGIGLFSAGWIALGALLWRRPYAFSSTPT